MTLQTIPLNQLVLAPCNVRKTGAVSIDDLAASIAAHGLLQNLQVRALPGDGDHPTETYEVVAGGRRLAALKQLVEGVDAARRSIPLPCNVLRCRERRRDQPRRERHPAGHAPGRPVRGLHRPGRAGHRCRRNRRPVRCIGHPCAQTPEAGVGKPPADGSLPRRRHDARAADGSHRDDRPRRAGAHLVDPPRARPGRHPAGPQRSMGRSRRPAGALRRSRRLCRGGRQHRARPLPGGARRLSQRPRPARPSRP